MSPLFQDLLLTVAIMLVVGIPLIMRNVWLPGTMQFEEVPEERLDERQRQFFSAADEKLGGIGFRPQKTFRVPNFPGKNLLRVYSSSGDPARIMVAALRVQRTGVVNYTEIVSKFQDGTRLHTNNSGTEPVFDPLPGDVKLRCPGVQDILQLKRRHDAKAAELTGRGIAYYQNDRIFEDQQEYHRRTIEHQRKRKLLRLDERTGIYRATPWMALRGIRNFLNPFGGNFTLARFLYGVAFGSALPLLRLYIPLNAFLWVTNHLRLSLPGTDLLLTFVAFTLSGVAVGYIFRRKCFIWAILLSLPAVYLMSRAGGNPLIWCVWMAAVAHWVARWRAVRESLV